MAKATLPTNFKDDILASSMGSKRRYNVINNSDGTISLEDVTTYTQVGSTFGAAQINATNKAANAAADASKIIDDYDTLMANTQAGYMAGALAVKKLNSNLISFENYTTDYSEYDPYNEYRGTKNLSLTLEKGQYAIVACWNGGRLQVAPTVKDCTEIGRTYSSYCKLTSTNDGGIAYLIIYKADIDGATITYNASWANCVAVVFK